MRKKGIRRPKLSVGEKLDILHKVIVEMLPWWDISKEYRDSFATIGMLVGKVKKKPKFLEEIHLKQN